MFLRCFLFLVLVVTAMGQVPQSPCPDVFSYRPYQGEYFGYILIPKSAGRQELTVSMSSAVPMSPNMLLTDGAGNNVIWVKFPTQYSLPIVNWITFNGHTICENRGHIPNSYIYNSKSTTVVEKKSYSSLGGSGQNEHHFESSSGNGFYSSKQSFSSTSFGSHGQNVPSRNGIFGSRSNSFGDHVYDTLPQNIPLYEPETRPATVRPVISNFGFGPYNSNPSENIPVHRPSEAQTSPTTRRTPRPTTPTTPTTTLPPVLPHEVECGIAQVVADLPLIHHGTPTRRGQWPWLAALYLKKDNSLICGGSMVDLSHIVTAAHCVFPPSSSKQWMANEMYIVMGKYNLKSIKEKGNQVRQVKTVHVHPEYNHTSKMGDIALLELANPVRYTMFVRPICLWEEDVPIEKFSNQSSKHPGAVVGWGNDEKGNLKTDRPEMAYSPIVSQAECQKSHKFFESRVNEMSLCAGFKNGSGPCRGDSGGGLMIANPEETDDKKKYNRYYLQGVVSLAQGSNSGRNNSLVCNLHEYVIYTNVNKYLDWLRQYIHETWLDFAS